MADVITGSTATSAVQQAAIAQLVQRNLYAKSVLLGSIWDLSSLAAPGDVSVKLPTVSNFTVTKKSSGTAVDAAALTYGGDTMNFDQHAVVQFLIEKRASIQSRIALANINMQRAMEAHAKQIDTDIHAALIAGVSTSAPDHVIAFAGASFDKADILEARRLLDNQEWPSDGRTLAIHPDEEKAMLSVEGFVDASKFGSAAPVQTGVIGNVYGIPVRKSTVVTSGRPLMYAYESACIAFQAMPEMDSQKDLANVATRYSLDQLYGLKVLQSGKGIVRMGSAT